MMTEDDFVEGIEKCAPTVIHLVKLGLTTAQAERLRKRNQIPLRNAVSEESDPLLRLIRRYDVTTLRVGMVRFICDPVREDDLVRVGELEADPLVMNTLTGEIEVRDLTDTRHLLWPCARGGGELLHALLVASRFLSLLTDDRMPLESQEARCRIAEECALAAGGDRYSDFYKMLVGCDS